MAARRPVDPAIADLVEAPLPVEEFVRRVNAPLTDEEIEETLALVAWFTRRYPTVKQRLAYARRAWKQWTRPMRMLAP